MQKDVLLLGGWGRTKSSYKKLINSAPDNLKIETLELKQLLDQYTLSSVHEIILEHLASKGIEKLILIAHSLGGLYAIDFAYHYPEKIERIFLLNVAGTHQQMSLFHIVMSVLRSKKVNFKLHAKVDFTDLVYIIKHSKKLLRIAEYARVINLQKEAGYVRVPTTIFWGEKDYILPVSEGEKLHKLIKNSELMVLPTMDHDWPLHAPELFWKQVTVKK